jgi:hypothetical protein
MRSLAADLIALTRQYEPAIPPEWRPAREMDAAVLSLTGTWYWGAAPHILRAHPDNELSLTPLTGGGPPTRLPAGGGRNVDGTQRLPRR